MVPQAFQDVEPTVQCVERFGDGDFRAHFGYTNRGSRVDRLTPGTPWNSFSPQPTDRGQGAIYLPDDHPDTVQVEFKQGENRIQWTLGTTTVAAVRSGEGATRRCQASITVVKELHAPVGGRFNLLIDGEIAGTGANVGDGGTTGTVSVTAAPGSTSHRVDESGAGTTVLGRYETSIRCRWLNRTTPDRVDENGHALVDQRQRRRRGRLHDRQRAPGRPGDPDRRVRPAVGSGGGNLRRSVRLGQPQRLSGRHRLRAPEQLRPCARRSRSADGLRGGASPERLLGRVHG